MWGLAKVRVLSDGIYADEEELWLAICKAWNDMRELTNYSRNLVNSIPQRLQAIIDANGGHTRYKIIKKLYIYIKHRAMK